jgi:hypothetical protein
LAGIRTADQETGEGKSGEPNKSPWNSLEISRLLLGALTPIAIFALGYMVNSQNSEQAKQREAAVQHAAANQRIFEKRAEFWEKISPILVQVEVIVHNASPTNLPQNDLLVHYRECLDLRTLYAGFLTRPFSEALDEYLRQYDRYLNWVGQVREGHARYDADVGSALLAQNASLRDAARSEMSAPAEEAAP